MQTIILRLTKKQRVLQKNEPRKLSRIMIIVLFLSIQSYFMNYKLEIDNYAFLYPVPPPHFLKEKKNVTFPCHCYEQPPTAACTQASPRFLCGDISGRIQEGQGLLTTDNTSKYNLLCI